MASLDNFHTNNGAWVSGLYATEHQHMNQIGRGVHSPDMFDLHSRLPVTNCPLDKARHDRQTPQPRITQVHDSAVRDLYVPLASQHVHMKKGDNVNSHLLYDQGVRTTSCPFRRMWNAARGGMICVPTPFRYTPY